jgi:hypothetical protein
VRTARGYILAAGAAALVAAVAALSRAPAWAWAVSAVIVLPLLVRAGRPAGKPIVTAATLPAAVQAPTQDVITRALGSLGSPGSTGGLGTAASSSSRPPSVRMAPRGAPRSTCRTA